MATELGPVRPMNFCFANNFPDGTVYLSHSIGTHMKDERHVNMSSPDNGMTWRQGGPMGGMNTFLTRDGKKRRVTSWSLAVTNVHDVQVMTLGADGKPVRKVVKIKTPRMQQFRLHRNVVRLADDRLLLTGYSQDQKAKPWHCTAFAVGSDDDGETFERFDVYKGMGSSYSTLMETAPGKLLLVYDESSFIGKPGETATNRIVAVNFNYKR